MFRFSQFSVYDALEELANLREEPCIIPHMKHQVQTLQLELELLKMSILCLPKELALDNYDAGPILGLYSAGVQALDTEEFKDWNSIVSKLQEQIDHIKPSIRRRSLDLLGGSAGCKFSTLFVLISFLGWMLNVLKGLARLTPDKIVAVKEQIEVIDEKIKLFRDFADFINGRCNCPRDLQKFFLYIQDWTCKAVCLLLLYWIDGAEEQMTARLNDILSDLLTAINPCTPEVTGMYLRVLKASKSSDSDNLLMGQIVSSIVDSLLESKEILVRDSMITLRDGLIILTTFLINPPKSSKYQKVVQIQKQVDVILTEAVFVICSFSDRGTNAVQTDKECSVLCKLVNKIDIMIRAKIKKFYFNIVDSSRLNFPKTNVLGFIDFLVENLGNLKERLRHNTNLIPFAKHQVVSIHEELASARPFLIDVIVNMQDDQKNLWTKIVNMAHQADRFIDSCQIIGFPIWHTMISLSHVSKQIKLIKAEARITQENHRQTEGVSSIEVYASQTHHAQARIPSISEVVVGFEDEAKTVIDKLTRGSEHLKVISIVGMPGIGKTTLAKKVYNDASVQLHFNICAWCSVSQSYDRKELLLSILNNLSVEGLSDADEDDLAQKLWRRLTGLRYLIVMDDIWDSVAWEKLKDSFPKESKGSRIIFTSRIQNIRLTDEYCNYAHAIRLLSNEESLILLQEKLDLKDGIPSNLSTVAEQIMKICKGLPLSIIVVAGLLARESWNIDWWKHIAKRLDSKLANEGGYMDILQVSYNHLPDALRPCFLYFGAFREDQVIEVQKLTQLWVAEGFIQKNGMKSLEDLAMEYLLDLISRSLVIVAKRSPSGEIKACQIHDLLHKLCLEKAREEKFLCSVMVNDDSNSIKYDQHRLCVHGNLWWLSLDLNCTSNSSARTLLFGGHCSLRPRHISLFNFLRVLNFESFHTGWDLHPEIVSLTHLRYLGVRCSISRVLSSIANLQNLQTFRVSFANSRIDFPASIWTMKNLKHVDVGSGTAVIALDDDDLVQASQTLDQLDSFSWLALGDSDDAEKTLSRLPRVRKLSIIKSTKRDCCQGCNQFPVMDFLSNLESLKLSFDSKVYHTCPFSFPSTLKKLTLTKSCRPWTAISVIGTLPHLEVLKLLLAAFVGEYWEVEDQQFLKLKYLKLKDLDIVQWNVSIDSFTSLEALVLHNCFHLEEINSGLGDLSTLKIIKLYGCNKARSAVNQILEEQQGGGNEGLQVLIKNGNFSWCKSYMDEIFQYDSYFFRYFKKRNNLSRRLLGKMPKFLTKNVYPETEDCLKVQQDMIPFDNFVNKLHFTKVGSKTIRTKARRSRYNYQPRQPIIPRNCHESLK